MPSQRRDLIARVRAGGAAGLAVLLVACGGGGSDPVAPNIRDSFGRQLAADSGFAAADAGVDGTVAEGSPAAGAAVLLTDMDGRQVAAAADAGGYYRMKVTGLRPPFLLRATTPTGRVLQSLDVRPVRGNAFIAVNISGLTDKIASDLAVQAGVAGPAQLTPQLVDTHQRHIATALAFLRAAFADAVSQAGLDPATFDPLTVPFRADHTGYDQVLDRLQATGNGSGPTFVVDPQGGFLVGPPPGLWQARVSRDGSVWSAGLGELTAPSEQDLAQADVSTIASWLAPAFDGTVQVSGNTVTLSGPDTAFVVRVDSFGVSDFQGCSVCEVGDTVSYTLGGTVTWGGTLRGTVVPRQTVNRSASFVYRSAV